jgi:parallel beta-helix repeat protein
MATKYVYSISSDFNGNLVAHELQQNIGSASIEPECTSINTDDDVVDIWFASALSTEEQTTLTGVVASYIPYVVNTAAIFDATVDSKYAGDYTSVAAAFADGKLSVFVRDGIYVETSNIIIPDGGQLVGESQGNVKLVMVANNSVVLDGSGGVKESSGTVTATLDSKTVVGVGTTFTNLSPGDSIVLGSNFYLIASIVDATNLLLVYTYRGKTISGISYIAQTMKTGCKVSNIVIANSSTTGLYLRGIKHSSVTGVAITGCSPNIEIYDSGDSSIRELINMHSSGNGMVAENIYGMMFNTLDIFNASDNGIELKGNNYSNIFDSCCFCNNKTMGFNISGTTVSTNITDNVIKNNGSVGFSCAAASTDLIFDGCSLAENGDVGMNINGTNNIISSCLIEKNKGDGINGGADCVITGCQIKNNEGNGIHYSAPTDNCTITGNRILANTIDGIDIVSDNCVISNNIVAENSANGIDIDGSNNTIVGNNVCMSVNGIVVSATSTETLINSNQSFMNSGTGVIITSGAANCMVTHNILTNNTTTGLSDAGTGTVIASNI